MTIFYQAFGLMIFLTICVSAHAEVLLRERFEHYPISPTNVQEIKYELRYKSPVSQKQKAYHGGTQWKLTPRYYVKVIDNLCKVSDVIVTLEGTYTMPKMVNRTTASDVTVDRFDAHYESLLEHEVGHRDLWLKAGEEIESRLNLLPAQYHCSAVKEAARQTAEDIVLRYQLKNQQYDETTGFGKTQGAYITD